MKKLLLFFAAILFTFTASLQGQNLTSVNGGYSKKEKINGKKFRVMYYEYEIDKTVEEVWEELAGNFVNVANITTSISESYSESGEHTSGLGAKRFCAIDFQGKKIEIKEEIIEFTESPGRNEFTYDVYESKGFPAKVYNTWVVRKGDDGKTYLGTAFKMRSKIPFMTGIMARKLRKSGGIKNGVLAYKHFLEQGVGQVDPEVLAKLYPDPPAI